MTILCDFGEHVPPAALHALPEPVAVVPNATDAADLLEREHREHLVVLGPHTSMTVAAAFAAATVRSHPDVAVIAMRDELDVAEIRNAMRAGMRDVVAADDPGELADACARALRSAPELATARNRPAQERPGRVITVFSPKGGAGKTTMSTNLAVALNDRGRNRVCIIDLDLAFGDVGITLQLEPAVTIVDAVGLSEPTPNDLAGVLTSFRPNLDCVLAPISPSDIERIPAALVTTLITALQQHYDFVVVDTPSQLSEHVMAAMDVSTDHVLVTTPELPSLKNLRLTLDVLELLGNPAGTRAVVLNRADDQVGLNLAAVQRVVKAPVAACIPSSPDVPRSINRGIPIVEEHPEHPVSLAIRRLAAEHFAPALVISAKHRGLGLHTRFMRRRTA